MQKEFPLKWRMKMAHLSWNNGNIIMEILRDVRNKDSIERLSESVYLHKMETTDCLALAHSLCVCSVVQEAILIS